MSDNTQYLERIQDIIDDRLSVFKKSNSITERNRLPADGVFPLKDNHWCKVKDVVCIYADIRNSTKLGATAHGSSTASVFELFTGTAVRLLDAFEASYIDVKGDGVFGLFNHDQPFRAIAAAITFKTFAANSFLPSVKTKIPDVDIGFHMGMDRKTVLVKQIGIRDAEGRDSRKNEVWAGKPISMAAKLASHSQDKELWVSDRFYNVIKDEELVAMSCGCQEGKPGGAKVPLWEEQALEGDDDFDFASAYVLKSLWCGLHGKEWCEAVLALDD